MNRLKIPVLPHIVNALIILSIFSTTNSYVFSASRSMVGLAHRGMAPKILLRQSKRGLPYIAVIIVLLATCTNRGRAQLVDLTGGIGNPDQLDRDRAVGAYDPM